MPFNSAKFTTLTPSLKLSRYTFTSVPLRKTVVPLVVRCKACSSLDEVTAASNSKCSEEGTGAGSGSGETSSLFIAEGMTTLIKSSDANRSSFRSRSFPMALDDVSVVSEASTSTGVGIVVLAAFGLNRSYPKISFDQLGSE